MQTVPPKLNTGIAALDVWSDRICRAVQARTPLASTKMLLSVNPQGYTLAPIITASAARGFEEAITSPFQVYQHGASTPNATIDWRTVRVHVGQAYGATPDNTDDKAVGTMLEIVVPASTTGFKIWGAVMRNEDGSVGFCTVCYSGWSGTTSGGSGIKTGSGTNGWPNYPAKSAISNVIWFLLATVDTTADSGAGSKQLTIHQVQQGNIDQTLLPWGRGQIYQSLASFADTATATIAVTEFSIGPVSAGLAATGITTGDQVWAALTLDSDTGIPSEMALAFGVAMPDEPTPPNDGTCPTSWYYLVGTVAVASNELSVSQMNPGDRQIGVLANEIICDGNGLATTKLLGIWT